MTAPDAQLSTETYHEATPGFRTHLPPAQLVGLGWGKLQVLNPELLPNSQAGGECCEPDIRECLSDLGLTVLWTF